jgi:hypothetical protein
MSAFNSSYTPYPPIQNGKEKRGGLLLPADYTRLITTAERTGLALLLNPPRARVYRSGNQSIATATNTVVVYDNSRYNNPGASGGTNPWANPNLSRLTVPAGGAGLYAIFATILFEAAAAGVQRQATLLLNSATQIDVAEPGAAAAAGNGNPGLTLYTEYQLVAGDYIEVNVVHDRGVALNVLSLGNFSPEFGFHRICA